MNPTQTLMNEHRLIEKVLAVLADMAREAGRSGKIDTERAAGVLTFLREFADRCHHGKEEKQLFPRLARYGYTAEMGPVAVMLHEHEIGRAHIRGMLAALETPAAPASTAKFADEALGYVALLESHIQKEDEILFQLADQVFSATDQSELAEAFERVEIEEMGPGAHEKLHALAERLIAGTAA